MSTLAPEHGHNRRPSDNTLWFGGSFNPIHHGHLICARAVAEAAGYGKVVLVPSAQPPHKPGSTELAAAEHRLNMVRLAVEGSGLFEVDDLELRRNGPSYTIDTVRELRRRGHPTVSWLMGADMAVILPKWREPEALVSEARLVLMARPGWSMDFDALPEYLRPLRQQVVEAPLVQISATDIRRRLREGRSAEYLTPPAVIEYIRANGLYG